jgi:ariadne-1
VTGSRVDTISSQTKKRKAEASLTSVQDTTRSTKRLASARVHTPPTPLTTGSQDMDSEDDFMSGVSSDEDDVLQDESDGDDGSVDGA